MNKIYILAAVLLVFCQSCKTGKPVVENPANQGVPLPSPGVSIEPQKFNYYEASSWIIGYFRPARFYAEPHSEWYVKGFDEYNPDSEAVSLLKNLSFEGITIKIVLGTWCPDSRREVPHFMRVLKDAGFPEDKVQLIGVDNAKFSPVDNYADLGIERVPTFIFYKNKVETGRIIENPATSLERDMVNILTRNENK